jgi:hypothetical protein
MEPCKALVVFITIFLCSIAFCQEKPTEDADPNRPFIDAESLRQVPKVIAYGLVWPSSQEMDSKRISTSSEVQQHEQTIITKCMKPSLFDPNAAPKLTSLCGWPKPNSKTRITRYRKKDYIFNIYDDKGNLFVGIKRADGNDIWDMSRDHSEFVSWSVNKFFLSKNVGPRPDKRMHYVPNKDGTDSFYYGYLPAADKDFWAAYIWTDGKIIVLRTCKRFEEDKKKAAKEETQ